MTYLLKHLEYLGRTPPVNSFRKQATRAIRPAKGGIEFCLHRLGAVDFTGSTVLPRGCIQRHPGELEPGQRGETRLLNLHDVLQPSSAALGSEHVRQGQEHGSI